MNKKIQILRAIAILAVVAIHTSPSGAWGVMLRPFANFAVALFIFLSGYLTHYPIEHITLFYKKRFLRVFIPYVIWSLIYTALHMDYSNFLINFITARCCNIYYYIAVYIQFILITPLLGKLITSKYKWVAFIITPVAILIQYVLTLIGKPLSFPWNANNLLVWFIYYYIGLMLGNKILKPHLKFNQTIILLILSIILQELEGFGWYIMGSYNMATTQIKLTSMITSLMVIYLTYIYLTSSHLTVRDTKITKVLIEIGNCSFGIYLSHILIKALFNKLPLHHYVVFPLNTLIILFLTTACVFIGKKICGEKIGKYLGLL